MIGLQSVHRTRWLSVVLFMHCMVLAPVLYIIYYCNNVDRQKQEQLDVQIDIDESLIREREERIRQIEVSPLQQEQQTQQ